AVRRRLARPAAVGRRGPGGDLAARGVAELGQDVGDVPGRGGRADVKLRGDVLVTSPLRDQPDDLALARREGARGQPGGPGVRGRDVPVPELVAGGLPTA